MAKNQAKSLKNYDLKAIYVTVCVMQLNENNIRNIFGKAKYYTSFLNYLGIMSVISITNGLNLKQISRMLNRAESNTVYYLKKLHERGFLIKITRKRNSNLGYEVKAFGYIVSNKGLRALQTIEDLVQEKYHKIIVGRGLVHMD